MCTVLKIKKRDFTEEIKGKLIEDLKVENTTTDEVFYAYNENNIQETDSSYKITVPFFYGKNFKGKEKKTVFFPIIENFTLREHQFDIVTEALSELAKKDCCTIEIPPGQGKTVIGIFLSESIGSSKTLIVYPSKISSLAKQWQTTLLKFEGRITEENIYVVEDSVQQEKKKFKKNNNSSVKEFFSTSEKIKYIICGDTRVPLFSDDKKLFDTVIIDEAHMLCTEKKLNSVFFNLIPKKIITLTATLERIDGLHRLLYLISGSDFSIKRLPSLPFEVRIKKVAGLQEGEIRLTFNEKTKKMDFTEYCHSLSSNEKYNDAIIEVVKKSISQEEDRKVIILTKFIEHAHFLSEKIIRECGGIKVAVMCGSKVKSHVDEKVLVGTIPKLSTGYDMATAAINYDGVAADTLIVVHPIKQYQLFEQCKGRVMRTTAKKPVIYFFEIPGLKFSTKHILELEDYIVRCGGEIKKIDF